MTRAVFLLLAMVLAGCSASAGEGDAREVPAMPSTTSTTGSSAPLRVLVAGDSIADGYYASTSERGFVGVLDDWLAQDTPVVPVTVAVSGARAFRVAASVESQTVVAEPFDVAVLEAGTNDVGVSTVRDLRVGYRRLLVAVHAKSPDAEVVCLGPWDKPRAARRYEAVLRRLCSDYDFVPLSDLFADHSLHGPAGTSTELGRRDWFHPNDRGHTAIAARVAAALIDD